MNTPKVALVTGASQGIGAATALRFAKEGYRVSLVARGREALERVAQQIEADGGEAFVAAADLSDLDAAQAAVAQTVEHWGRLDVLVNNAAWREIVSMRKISLESWEKTLRVNVTAPAFLARWAAETMEKQQSGVIINISSVVSQRGSGQSPAYVASKGAIDSLTYELASLYGPSGIRVLAINPGAIDTEMSRDLVTSADGTPASQDPVLEYAEDMIMLSRLGQPEEMAELIVAMAGDAGSYITGTTLVADGGWLRQHFPTSLLRRIDPGLFE